AHLRCAAARIDQVGPLKNVKVVPLPKPHGPGNWWIGGVNIMRHGPADNLRVKIEEDLCGDGSRVGLRQRLFIGQNPDASLSHQTVTALYTDCALGTSTALR
ncbi:hypothetical protein FOZ62_004510, partial [Perkinsus olseni]